MAAEVRVDLAGEDADRGRLPDAVRSEDAGDAALLWGRQSVQRERVVAVAVGGRLVEFLREVDDLERSEERRVGKECRL